MCTEGYEVCCGSIRSLVLAQSLDPPNIAPRFHLERDMVVPLQDGCRGNRTRIVYVTEKWARRTRHRPIQKVTGNTFAKPVLVSKAGRITDHHPGQCSVLELKCANYFVVVV